MAQDLDAGTSSDVSSDACVCADVDAECLCGAVEDPGAAISKEVAEQKVLIKKLYTQTQSINSDLADILMKLEKRVKNQEEAAADEKADGD